MYILHGIIIAPKIGPNDNFLVVVELARCTRYQVPGTGIKITALPGKIVVLQLK